MSVFDGIVAHLALDSAGITPASAGYHAHLQNFFYEALMTRQCL